MGVDVICRLPADVHVKDASEVIGILAGLPLKENHFEGKNGREGWCSQTVPGVVVKGNPNSPTLGDIFIKGDLIDGETSHYSFWNFEGYEGTRSFSPKSTPFWIAICKGLVDFFGGELIYNDCSTSLCDYRKSSRYSNSIEGYRFDHGDDLYESMLERKRTLKPLTLDNLKEAQQHASYQTPEVFHQGQDKSEWYALLGKYDSVKENAKNVI